MRGRLAGGARGLELARIEDDVIALLKLAAPLAAAGVNARRDLALIVSTFLLQFRQFRQSGKVDHTKSKIFRAVVAGGGL